MGFDAALKQYSQSLQLFLQGSSSRWTRIRNKVKDPAQTYGADEMANDVAESWVDSMDLWWSLWPYPSPVPSTAFIKFYRASPGTPGVDVSLAAPVDTGQLTVTPLLEIGGSNTIPGSVGFVPAATPGVTDVRIELTGIAANTASLGLYQGFVYVGSDLKVTLVVLVE